MAITWGKAFVEAGYIAATAAICGVAGVVSILWLQAQRAIPPTSQVQALATLLRTGPGLGSLPAQPYQCREWRKHRPLGICHYRGGDIHVSVSWSLRSHRLRSVSLTRNESRDGAPFARANLTQLLPMLCRDIEPMQADELVADALAKLDEVPWRKLEKPDTFAGEGELGARRHAMVKQGPNCWLHLTQVVGRDAVRSTIELRPFDPRMDVAQE